jgi:hypothetical protein
MRRVLTLVAAAVMFVALAWSAPPAFAHPTGKEVRRPAACKRLPPRMRAACRACVKRARPHHFHPGYPVGRRCRPNNGRP